MSIQIENQAPPLHLDPDGVVRVGDTRVTLDSLVAAFTKGFTAEEIAQQFPSVALVDVYAVITYYLRHREDVERYLAVRRERAGNVRQTNPSISEQKDIRERLMARRESGS